MSLDWSIEACKDHEALLTEEEWPITQAMIFATVAVGMPTISKANASRFAARLALIDCLGKHPTSISLADVRRRIGLVTNATPRTDRQFAFQEWELFRRDWERAQG